MALDKANLRFILFQREQLQISVLDPLQRIKGAVGRCLPLQKVEFILSLLSRDVRNDSLSEVDDGEVLMEVLDFYYGKDNLNFIERLLNEANLQDLAQMLRNWKSRSRSLVSNIFYRYGFFPLWIKANYNFIEFSQRREDIFRTLKIVFGIPETNPSTDPMVYMGVSLGKRDVLLCVLVPYSLRHHIKTSLKNNEMASQLKSARICGVYFSRVKKGLRQEFSKEGIQGSHLSISSISESMTSSDYGELHDAAYEDIANRYQMTSLEEMDANVIYRKNDNSGRYGNDIVGKLDKPQLVRITKGDIGSSKIDENGNIIGYYGNDDSGCYGSKIDNPQLVRMTGDNGNSERDENEIVKGYQGEVNSGSNGYQGDSPQPVHISSGYLETVQNNGYHGYEKDSYGHPGNERDEPQLVRISSGYVRQDPSNKVTKAEEQKPSYGRCFVVGYKSKGTRRDSTQGNQLCDHNDASHYGNEYDRPQDIQEEIMSPQQTDFVSDEPEQPNGNHRNELLPWNEDGQIGDRRVSPCSSDQDQECDHISNRWYPSRDTAYNVRNNSYYGNDIDYDSHRNRTEHNIPSNYLCEQQSSVDRGIDTQGERYHHGNVSSYHSDKNKSNYNGNSYHRTDNDNESGRLCYHGDEQFNLRYDYGYGDNINGHHGNEHFHYKIEHDYDNHEYDYYGNQQDHHSNRNSYLTENSNYHDNELSHPHRHNYELNYIDYEQSKDDFNYSSHGNEPSYCHEGDIMIPQPEPKPRPRSVGDVVDWQSTSWLPQDFAEPVRRSTPTSSMSSFAKYESSYKPETISRSMPVLHSTGSPRGNSADWLEGNTKYTPQAQSQDALMKDCVFVETYHSADNQDTSPPPYSAPPNYRDTMIKKSFLSLSSVCSDSRCKSVTSPLLSSHSVSSIYREKEQLLNRVELHESIRSAEEKQWEILLDKSKELLVAAKVGDEEEVQALLDEGVDVDYRNEFNITALMIASREGHLPIIHVLISYNADLNTQDKYGKSPLHEASWSGHHQVIHPLVSNGANVNVLDDEERTPLHYSALRGKTKVAESLLLYGADASILNKDGESAVEVAYKGRHKDIVKLLLNSMDKETKKEMQGKLRKLRIARIKSMPALPNLSKRKP